MRNFDGDPRLQVVDVSRMLRVSPDTVRRWADSGLLASVRLPSGHRRFELADVKAFAEDFLSPSKQGGTK